MNPDSPEPVGPPPPIRVRGQACDMGPPLAVRLPEIVIERDRADYKRLLAAKQQFACRAGGEGATT